PAPRSARGPPSAPCPPAPRRPGPAGARPPDPPRPAPARWTPPARRRTPPPGSHSRPPGRPPPPRARSPPRPAPAHRSRRSAWPHPSLPSRGSDGDTGTGGQPPPLRPRPALPRRPAVPPPRRRFRSPGPASEQPPRTPERRQERERTKGARAPLLHEDLDPAAPSRAPARGRGAEIIALQAASGRGARLALGDPSPLHAAARPARRAAAAPPGPGRPESDRI